MRRRWPGTTQRQESGGPQASPRVPTREITGSHERPTERFDPDEPAGAARSGLVKVSYGVHNLEAAIAGKSVSEVRQALKEPLNIDPRALALVNGRDVAASYVLKQNDQLEFVRLAGEKGRRLSKVRAGIAGRIFDRIQNKRLYIKIRRG